MTTNIKQSLRQVVSEWQIRKLPEAMSREVDLSPWVGQSIKKIIAVVGFRRVGKTYILLNFAKQIGQENCLYINFEDERLPKNTNTLTSLLEIVSEYYPNNFPILLLDEIQNIPDWSRWARRVNETTNFQLILSGSSSKLSSAEIPTELRGRTITKTVFPLNFSEFISWKKLENNIFALSEYLRYGGFPEIVISDEGKKPLLLDEYYQTFLVRDIIERYHPRQESAIRDLIRLVVNSPYYTIGKLTKSLNLASYIISKGTVSNYILWLTSSYFMRSLEIESPKVKSKIQHPKKPYFIDSYFISRLNETSSENISRQMEHAVAQHLFRDEANNPNLSTNYWKDQSDKEVDFVVKNGLRVTNLIQVSFITSSIDIAPRETSSLIKASNQLNCQNLTLVTWDYKADLKIQNKTIHCIPIGSFI